MAFINDFECPKCGIVKDHLTDGNVKVTECPDCGGGMKKVFLKTANYHMDIETWVEHQRGHLDSKIAKSVKRERAMKEAVERRKRSTPPSAIPLKGK